MINRQEIIEKTIHIENLLSLLITFRYFPEKKAINSDFLQEVLYDPLATSAFKINLLQICYPEFGEDNIQRLRRIFNIRNLFAHCGLEISSVVDPKNFSVIDPNKKNVPLDWKTLTEEFNQIASELENNLFGLIKQKGISISDKQENLAGT